MTGQPDYKHLRYWLDNYGQGQVSDQRSVETFMDCEAQESVRMLRNELAGVRSGNFTQDKMLILLGGDRLAKHQAFEEWAKFMLIWIANYKH